MTIKKTPNLEAWAGIQQEYVPAVLSKILDKIIVSNQLHVYHLSDAVCWTEMSIKGGYGYSFFAQ